MGPVYGIGICKNEQGDINLDVGRSAIAWFHQLRDEQSLTLPVAHCDTLMVTGMD